MFEKLKVLAARLDELEMRLSAPDLYDDPDRAAKLLRERNELEPIVTAFREYEQAQRTLADATEMLSDPDMKELAQEELQNAKENMEIVKNGITSRYKELSNTQIRSTIDGMILDVPIKVGQLGDPGQHVQRRHDDRHRGRHVEHAVPGQCR